MSTYRARSTSSKVLTATLVVVAVLIVAGIVSILVVHRPKSTAANHGGSSPGSGTSTTIQQTAEAIAWTTPKGGQTGVSSAGPITVQLTEPLAPGSPMPSIS